MEIRHTIEILVKDIQDIEKLVANLQNSPRWPAIEMDLALSKLRNVYEVLSMIRDDRHQAANAAASPEPEPRTVPGTPEMGPAEVPPESGPGPGPAASPEPGPAPSVASPEAGSDPETREPGDAVPGPAPSPAPPEAGLAPGPRKPAPSAARPQPEHFSQSTREEREEQPARPGDGQPGVIQTGDHRPGGIQTGDHQPGDGQIDSGKIAAILAERFSREASINENMANQQSTSMEKRLAGKPIDNIARNIGINDRFMIIRELFQGNSEEYSRMIHNLDEAGGYENAMDLIREKFTSSIEHEGVGVLISLARRRFVRI